MPESFRVDAEHLHLKANEVLDHMDASRRAHAGHCDDLTAAAGKWNGEIAAALTHVATTWEDKRTVLHKRVGGMGTWMFESASSFVSTDENSKTGFDNTAQGL
ncbi:MULTISPECIES: hypothetical protein [Mycobacteroides]|jgi:predicted secreted protein|uniref:hypothetical protein n=1 Tax=Mycobacteroides TaxID=670516 RepID=UPI0012FFDFF6|nr:MULTISPECIES: hypothetical protein [Mycobacteroides]MBF9327947.1 hypothetical protein [Mycobacteroides chelonae]MBF9422125.1 hypothetical protein [Mycobacteroides chelonae]